MAVLLRLIVLAGVVWVSLPVPRLAPFLGLVIVSSLLTWFFVVFSGDGSERAQADAARQWIFDEGVPQA